ncbi:MAG: DUF308 domain-containing protein [Clostridiales Family XIII bacterium]|jgi:uncharacterized membrane protein HdeD (DUF308 family)|nr:DUF308 domain-containing protein [Clostridiales Family XIII bacterium]
MRIIIVVSGIFPIAAGVFFLVNEGQTFVAFAFAAGLALLVFSLLSAFAYLIARIMRDGLDLPAWFLANSLLSLILAVTALRNRIVDDDVAPAVFGVMLLAAGAACIAGSADMPKEKPGFKIVVFVVGFLSAIMGVYGFFRPFLPEIGMTGILGGIFILHGVSAVAVGAGISRKGYAKVPDAKAETKDGNAVRRDKGNASKPVKKKNAGEKNAAAD